MHKKKLYFGDVIFTMPTTYPGLQGIVSKAIHWITQGPTHVGLAISKKKVIHLDFPLLKIETIDEFLAERKIQLICSPKLGFLQKLKIRKKIHALKKNPLSYRKQDLLKIWAFLKFPKISSLFTPNKNPGVCSTFIAWLIDMDSWQLISPSELIKKLR